MLAPSSASCCRQHNCCQQPKLLIGLTSFPVARRRAAAWPATAATSQGSAPCSRAGAPGTSEACRTQGQHVHMTEAASGAATLGAASGPRHQAFASFTRVLLVGQPSAIVRNLAARKWRGAGPASLLLFLLGLVLAILTAIRTVLVKRVKECTCCRGYGIVRCRLCNGEGSVEWRGKNTHQETCPLCMTKRFVTCPECGGHYHKKMFIHIRPTTRAGVPDWMGAS